MTAPTPLDCPSCGRPHAMHIHGLGSALGAVRHLFGDEYGNPPAPARAECTECGALYSATFNVQYHPIGTQ